MSGSAEFDFSEFKEFAENFDRVLNQEETFMDSAMQEVGHGFVNALKLNTPVGQYDNTVFFVKNGKLMKFDKGAGRGRVGGYLRYNWFSDPVSKQGNTYVIEAYNNAYYAGWVNDGHRTADHKGWVEGQFFVEAALEEVEANLDPILYTRFLAFLERLGVG